jgi:retron-type reverse transcriptase
MKRAGYLFERVIAFDTLLLAARKAQRGKRHRTSVGRFLFHLEPELLTLQEELRTGTYRMRPYRTFTIYEPKQRQICAADFRDRVVQHAICHVLDPLFDACLIDDTYACRRGKGTHAAVRRAQQFARRFPYVLKGDVRKYYESIDHAVLKALLRRKLKDKALLALLDLIIDHPLPGGTPGKGLPIGNLTSQYFANLYLGELDHLVKEHLHHKGYVRYMDDVLVFASDKPHLHETLAAIRTFLHHTLHLTLKDEVTRLMPVTQGIAFLGFRIFPGLIRLDGRKWARVRRRVRQREAQYRCGMLEADMLQRSLTSMLGHISHANALAARRAFFARSRATSRGDV